MCYTIRLRATLKLSINLLERLAGHACGPRPVATSPWTPARDRLRELVDRARGYATAIREEPGLTQGKLGRREGVSGARVNQVLSILRLDPSILANLIDAERDTPVPSLDELFAIGRISGGRAQVARYRAVCAALAGERAGVQARPARQRGFQHLFARARAWQTALDAVEFRSLSELAAAEGLTHHRVAQVLDLLTLPVEIQAALDVPAEELPKGITQAEVRRLVRTKGVEVQREGFATVCARSLP
ncbi:MAG: hypothetical protein EA397_16090 [Deltaproteobacteria bacterium]|nr:MAG: hypothetical protein EA397_16090 [Deltaproteobacteria bacterium]